MQARIGRDATGTAQVWENVMNVNFSWAAMETQSLAPPFQPSLRSKTDLKNFRVSGTQMPPTFPYRPEKDLDPSWASCFEEMEAVPESAARCDSILTQDCEKIMVDEVLGRNQKQNQELVAEWSQAHVRRKCGENLTANRPISKNDNLM